MSFFLFAANFLVESQQDLRKPETETEVPTLRVPRMEKADRGFAAAAAAGIKAGGHE